MLPGRSKRYAVVDGEIPRLVLTRPWQLALIALMVSALLVTIFPQKALVDTLYAQQELDPLTLSYIQNLYRAETSNVDVALLLARSQGKTRDVQSLEPVLLQVAQNGTIRQRQEAYTILFESYNRELSLSLTKADKARVTGKLSGLLQNASKEELPKVAVQAFAVKAFELGMSDAGLAFMDKLKLQQPSLELEELGNKALASGQHEGAAIYFMLARDRTSSIGEARRLFRKGIETYMAASLFKEAMRAASGPLGDLESDLPTLRFLARTAIAAGDPARAASFARRLVFMASEADAKP